MIQLYGGRDCPSRLLLAHSLLRAYHISPLPEIARTSAGKPFFPAYPGLFFNVSHSGPWVLCGMGTVPLGVDIEQITPRRPSLAQFALSEPEYREFLRRGGDWPSFYALWTRREAWCKWTGKGLQAHWKKAPPEIGLYFSEYAGETWRAAGCAEEALPESIHWCTDVREEDP